MLQKLLLYLNTIKHLKSKQIYFQVHRKIKMMIGNNISQFENVSITQKSPLTVSQQFLQPNLSNNEKERLLKGIFTFINQEQEIHFPPKWNAQYPGKLWEYNLQYFEWIWLLDYENAKVAVEDWLNNCPVDPKTSAWEPYPISLRLINWLMFFCYQHNSLFSEDDNFKQKLIQSISQQTNFLYHNLEYHILGNHLLENAFALTFIGVTLEGDGVEKWLKKGFEILDQELNEQILPDGVHFELSPMYHSRILLVLLNLANLNHSQLNQIIHKPLQKMLSAFPYLLHPDGNISLFNDSAFEIYTHPKEILNYSEKIVPDLLSEKKNHKAWQLPDSGYFGYKDTGGNYLICDAGKIGPDYIPGHAHGDMFSFELSLSGHRVIVDSGNFDYNNSEMRKYCRSTKAHNTVEINELDQSTFWGAFRVAERATPKQVEFIPDGLKFSLQGSHAGYSNYFRDIIHSRRFIFKSNGEGGLRLKIQDEILPTKTVKCISRLHLHPDCKISNISDNMVEVRFPAGHFAVKFSEDVQFSKEVGWYCPQFNVRFENTVLAFSWQPNNNPVELEIIYNK